MTNLKVINSKKHTAYTYKYKGKLWFIIKDSQGRTLIESTAPTKKQLDDNVKYYLNALDERPLTK